MIKRLIVNGDDFGMCEGNSIGIILAHKEGILTSTTVMMNMPYAYFALDLAKKYPDLGVGVHLNATAGKPLTDIKLVDKKGYFLNKKFIRAHPDIITKESLYNEFKAQIDKYISYTGHLPTHFDSHHHIHLIPEYKDIIIKLSNEYQIPFRQRESLRVPFVRCIDSFEGNNVSIDYLLSILSNNDDTIEIMCHPGLIDQRLCDISSYSLPRMKELEIMRSKEVLAYIKENNIELINYSHIKTPQ